MVKVAHKHLLEVYSVGDKRKVEMKPSHISRTDKGAMILHGLAPSGKKVARVIAKKDEHLISGDGENSAKQFKQIKALQQNEKPLELSQRQARQLENVRALQQGDMPAYRKNLQEWENYNKNRSIHRAMRQGTGIKRSKKSGGGQNEELARAKEHADELVRNFEKAKRKRITSLERKPALHGLDSNLSRKLGVARVSSDLKSWELGQHEHLKDFFGRPRNDTANNADLVNVKMNGTGLKHHKKSRKG